jgi:hypothetical protein
MDKQRQDWRKELVSPFKVTVSYGWIDLDGEKQPRDLGSHWHAKMERDSIGKTVAGRSLRVPIFLDRCRVPSYQPTDHGALPPRFCLSRWR